MNRVLLLSISLVIMLTSCDNSADVDQQNQPEKPNSFLDQQKPDQASDSIVLGIDVSHFQGDVNWEDIKKDGIYFAYAKATEATGFKDPKFERNRAGATAARLPFGAYHFYMAGDDPAKQAAIFIECVQQINTGEMPPMLDLEQGGMKEGIDKETYQENVFRWLRQVEEKLGMKPVIYTDNSFANVHLTDPRFAEYDLWIAAYTKENKPRVPNTWKEKGWLIWQRSQRGTLTGVASGNVDHDIFNGPPAAFEELLKK